MSNLVVTTESPLIQLLRIFEDFSRVERRLEVQRVIDKLSIQISLSERKAELLNFIIQEVCSIYNLTEKKLFSSSRSMPLPEARRLCYVLMNLEAKIPEVKIAAYFKKDHACVFRAVKEYSMMNVKVKTDGEFIRKFSIIKNNIELLNTK